MTNSQPDRVPPHVPPHVPMALLGGLVALSALSIDLVMPAIADMTRAFGGAPGAAQYIITIYLFGFAAGQLFWGEVADRIGRRPAVMIALTLYGGLSAACAFAPTLDSLVWLRLLQGFAGAVGPVISRAIVRDIASGRESARMLSTMIAILGFAPMIAPLLGSFILIWTDWPALFMLLTAFGMALLIYAGLRLPETGGHIDHPGPWAASVMRSVRAFAHSPQAGLGLVAVSMTAVGFLVIVTSTSSLLADAYGVESRWFGFYFLAIGVPFAGGSLVSRYLLARYSSQRLLRLAAMIFLMACPLLAAMAIYGAVPLWLFLTGVAGFALAVGLALPNATAMALEPLAGMAGRAAAVLGTAQVMIGTVGSLLSSIFYDQTIAPYTLILAAAGLAAGAACWRLSKIPEAETH